MVFQVDEVVLSVTVPFAIYWITALIYESISRSESKWIEKYRIHPLNDEEHNVVPRHKVVLTVLAQHLSQIVLGLVFLDPPDTMERTYVGQSVRFLGAMICLDAWQYSFHRLMHEVDWLYNNIHIWHHKLFVPYAAGALYQHPVEMLIMDTLSGMVAVAVTGCSPLTAMTFWSLSYFKTVSDHSGLKFPLNPTNIKGFNNAAYHEIHHKPTGLLWNYAQPYFTYWDRILGSYKDPYDGVPLPRRKVA